MPSRCVRIPTNSIFTSIFRSASVARVAGCRRDLATEKKRAAAGPDKACWPECCGAKSIESFSSEPSLVGDIESATRERSAHRPNF